MDFFVYTIMLMRDRLGLGLGLVPLCWTWTWTWLCWTCYSLTCGEKKNKSIYILILYDDIIIIIISSTHRFMFPAIFCLKIQNTVCRLQSQRNGPQ